MFFFHLKNFAKKHRLGPAIHFYHRAQQFVQFKLPFVRSRREAPYSSARIVGFADLSKNGE